MSYEWSVIQPELDYVPARASGQDSASVLSLAFLVWLDERDVDTIANVDALAGFLAAHSDLTRRELAGLLGTFHFPIPPRDDQLTIYLDDADVLLTCTESPNDSSDSTRDCDDDNSISYLESLSPSEITEEFEPLSDEEFFERFGDD